MRFCAVNQLAGLVRELRSTLGLLIPCFEPTFKKRSEFCRCSTESFPRTVKSVSYGTPDAQKDSETCASGAFDSRCDWAFWLSALTMPIKNVRMSGHISELESNFKKDRYSLKKFLDRSRFSPRLLRFTRLSKSIECDTTKPGNTNSDFEPASNHIAKTTAHLCSGGSRETNVSSTTSSTHATVPSLCPVSNYTPILGHGIEANQTHELVVEEEYEESLSHFADVIIENLRTGNNFITNRSPDGISEVSDGRSSSYSTLPTTRLTTWGYPGHSPNCEPAKAACINSQRIPFTSFEQINHCAIYNEPCDAKPLLDGVVDGPPMIYTMSSLARELNEISANLESSPRSCTKSSPYSSTSNTTGHETRSLQSSVLEDRAHSVGNTSLRLVSPRESPKSIDGVSKLTRVTDGAVSVASHLVSVDPQPNRKSLMLVFRSATPLIGFHLYRHSVFTSLSYQTAAAKFALRWSSSCDRPSVFF
ncbi:unnamed protein product [Dicrocoelium dendriticum]|nr:unnamed protein product [Dicrocoelium dendriticum]